jgi:5-methylcytosine-specific restriction endonuclease McrA
MLYLKKISHTVISYKKSTIMPQFKDGNGVNRQYSAYPGSSFRAKVVNKALYNGSFIWVTVLGKTFPMFKCCQCNELITAAGVQGDHLIGQQHGGSNSIGNLQVLCSICNSRDRHNNLNRNPSQNTRFNFKKDSNNYFGS